MTSVEGDPNGTVKGALAAWSAIVVPEPNAVVK